MEIFRGFRVFEYTLMVKNENPETPEINIKFSKLKTPNGNGYYDWKTAKVQPIYYLSTILALITRKATFELQCLVSWINLSNTLKVMS